MTVRTTGGTSGSPRVVTRAARAVAVVAVLLLSACTGTTSGDSGADSGPVAASTPTTPAPTSGLLVVGGGAFTEMLVLQAMYGQLLDRAGYDIEFRTAPDRATYLAELEAGTVDIVPEYAATLAEFLNHEVNGPTATVVASSDPVATVAAIGPLAQERGLAVLQPAEAANQNGFAVTAAYARENKVTSLSTLAAQGEPLVLAGTQECPQRPFCEPGLERVYNLEISSVLPLGFGSTEAKQAVIDGDADLVLVGTTDGTLEPLGLQLLTDDQKLQPADNVIPVLNVASADQATVAAALDPLAEVLTTADLAALNEQVDGQRGTPKGVAADYLRSKKLLPAAK